MWSNNYTFTAEVKRVIDGDTFEVSIELPLYIRAEVSCRIAGINARELHEPGGKDAKTNLIKLLGVGDTNSGDFHEPYGNVILKTLQPDKYSGRIDAYVFLKDASGIVLDVGANLIAQGWAVEWNGTGERPLPVWPRPAPTMRMPSLPVPIFGTRN